jgi:hypothetical protein
MASSHSGSFAKRWFLGSNKMKSMSARQEILFKDEESHKLYFKLLSIVEYWKGGGGWMGWGWGNLLLKRWKVCSN